MTDVDQHSDPPSQAPPLQGRDGSDLVVAALDFLQGLLPAEGHSPGTLTLARQKEGLHQWARDLGLLLDPAATLPLLQRGGQDHDFHLDGDRVIKVTRHGVFGLTPGIALALVASSEDARRFHLWEASPLEHLHLQNELVPDLNRLEGVIVQADGDFSLVTSQPAFDIVPVHENKIRAWFEARGFRQIAPAAYYRAEDNLGVFDAHDKNVVRASSNPDLLIPFDVIPCHPAGGFLQFIEDTLAAGHTVHAVRSTHTTRPAIPARSPSTSTSAGWANEDRSASAPAARAGSLEHREDF